MRSQRWVWLILALGLPGHALSEDCDLSAQFGPVSFENERPVAALRKILSGTGISLVEAGEFDSTAITANNVSGTVGEAVRRLTEGTGLQYSCRNGVMRVSQIQPARPIPPQPAANSGAPAVTPSVAGGGKSFPATSDPVRSPVTADLVLPVRQGDSLKASLSAFAKQYGYTVSWRGDDLFARQDARFTGKSFDDVVNKFLSAARISAYVSNDEGNILNVTVQ